MESQRAFQTLSCCGFPALAYVGLERRSEASEELGCLQSGCNESYIRFYWEIRNANQEAGTGSRTSESIRWRFLKVCVSKNERLVFLGDSLQGSGMAEHQISAQRALPLPDVLMGQVTAF